MLGKSAKSQFADEKEFSQWCEFYCAQLLVDSATMEPRTLFANIGQARLIKVGQHWRVDKAHNIPSYGTLKAALGSLRTYLVQLIQSGMLTDSTARKVRAFSTNLARASTDADEQSLGNRLELTIGGGMVVLERTDSGWKLAYWNLPEDKSDPD